MTISLWRIYEPQKILPERKTAEAEAPAAQNLD
jgi:hypothetical protein